MRRVIIFFLFALNAVYTFSQVPKVGDKLPGLNSLEWYDEVVDLQEGKPLIIDFWFIKCAPCIWSIPKLNDLAKTYSGSDIEFVALTFDPRADVDRFLEKREMVSSIGLYEGDDLPNSFGVMGYPTSFIVDKDRTIRWKGHTDQLTEKLIDSILFQKKNLNKRILSQRFSNKEILEEESFIEITINDYSGASSGFNRNEKEIGAVNQSLKSIFSILTQTSKTRIEVPISDTVKFDFRIKLDDVLDDQNIWESVASHLGLNAKIVEKEVQGYELKVQNAFPLNTSKNDLGESPGFASYANSDLCFYQNFNLSMISGALENRFNEIIVYEGSIEDKYNFKLSCSEFQFTKKILSALYGIELLEKQITISKLVLTD